MHIIENKDHYRLGILFNIIAVFLFSILNSCVKWLSKDYHVLQISFFRGLLPLMFMLFWVLIHKDASLIATARPKDHFIRSFTGVISLYLMFIGFSKLPLPDVTTFLFSAPLFTFLLAVPMLKEKIIKHRLVGVIIGFCGILIAMKPSGQFNYDAFYPLAAAFFLSLSGVLIRSLGKTETSFKVTFYYHLAISICGLCALPFVWKNIALKDLWIFGLMALSGGLGQHFLNLAFKYVEVTALGPFFYLSIIWSTGLGYLLWDYVPSYNVVMGVVIIVLSGYYSHFQEQKRERHSKSLSDH
jgi:drug/metabolite transporter (DMT)-like permease